MSVEAPKVEFVDKTEVRCGGAGEHPKVWMVVAKEKSLLNEVAI